MAGRLGAPIYKSARWRRLRRRVLAEAGFRCQTCGAAGVLEVHHVTPLAAGGAAYERGNLAAVCRPCHRAEHNPVPAEIAAWRERVRANAG